MPNQTPGATPWRQPDRRLLQFGAGNIGRSFVAAVFADAGYQVVFVDVDADLIRELNAAGEYRVVTRESGVADAAHVVRGVSAIDGRDSRAVAAAVAEADLLATSVGRSAMPAVLRSIGAGIAERLRVYPGRTIDLIIAENIANGAEVYRRELDLVLDAVPWQPFVGLVETSIGKMVPITPRIAGNLDVFAERYNTLIVDARGFKKSLPQIANVKPVANIRAYVDRKLFVHNLAHAATAYLGYAEHPERPFIWQQIEDESIRRRVRAAMDCSIRALVREYPTDLTEADLQAHADDLLRRFANRALGDTVFRVGRDIGRKTAATDRLLGAIRLCETHAVDWSPIRDVFLAALTFAAVDEQGLEFNADALFRSRVAALRPEQLLTEVCGLSMEAAVDRRILAAWWTAAERR